jgi:hypothetical protein
MVQQMQPFGGLNDFVGDRGDQMPQKPWNHWANAAL